MGWDDYRSGGVSRSIRSGSRSRLPRFVLAGMAAVLAVVVLVNSVPRFVAVSGIVFDMGRLSAYTRFDLVWTGLYIVAGVTAIIGAWLTVRGSRTGVAVTAVTSLVAAVTGTWMLWILTPRAVHYQLAQTVVMLGVLSVVTAVAVSRTLGK